MSTKKFILRNSRRKGNAFRSSEEQEFLKNIKNHVMKNKAYTNISNHSRSPIQGKSRNLNRANFFSQRRSIQPSKVHSKISNKVSSSFRT
mmetsp:Transcript_12018/g.10614  ORF Transcript_12018/g.10614 Transcript_12018/m.10614 type:complete len:90 (-) Transcript_12018:547-816(-)